MAYRVQWAEERGVGQYWKTEAKTKVVRAAALRRTHASVGREKKEEPE